MKGFDEFIEEQQRKHSYNYLIRTNDKMVPLSLMLGYDDAMLIKNVFQLLAEQDKDMNLYSIEGPAGSSAPVSFNNVSQYLGKYRSDYQDDNSKYNLIVEYIANRADWQIRRYHEIEDFIEAGKEDDFGSAELGILGGLFGHRTKLTLFNRYELNFDGLDDAYDFLYENFRRTK